MHVFLGVQLKVQFIFLQVVQQTKRMGIHCWMHAFLCCLVKLTPFLCLKIPITRLWQEIRTIFFSVSLSIETSRQAHGQVSHNLNKYAYGKRYYSLLIECDIKIIWIKNVFRLNMALALARTHNACTHSIVKIHYKIYTMLHTTNKKKRNGLRYSINKTKSNQQTAKQLRIINEQR